MMSHVWKLVLIIMCRIRLRAERFQRFRPTCRLWLCVRWTFDLGVCGAAPRNRFLQGELHAKTRFARRSKGKIADSSKSVSHTQERFVCKARSALFTYKRRTSHRHIRRYVVFCGYARVPPHMVHVSTAPITNHSGTCGVKV